MFWIVVAVVVLAMLVFVLVKNGRGAARIGLPYIPAEALFSPAERAFLQVLDQAVGAEFRVFGKVRVADVAGVKPGLSNSARQGAINRIGSKHFDFVVCRRDDLTVVCVVELNDKSHASARVKARDELLASVCHTIGLPLLVVPAKRTYSLAEIRDELSRLVPMTSSNSIAV